MRIFDYIIEGRSPKGNTLAFFCPGCRCLHIVNITDKGLAKSGDSRIPIWQFNGDYDRPTLNPSVLSMSGTKYQCHSWIKDGQIQFLADSQHQLKNQTVDLPQADSLDEIELKGAE